MTIIANLFIMGIFDIGLNQVSLAALIMALGMLVDNAIVVSEAIVVKMEKGSDAKEAAIESARELAVPLLVSSLTTSAAFLSFFLAASIMGEMMGPLFSVIYHSLALFLVAFPDHGHVVGSVFHPSETADLSVREKHFYRSSQRPV